jgi:hypothetical protein
MKTRPAAYIYSNTEVRDILTDESVPLNKNGFIRGYIEHTEGSSKIRVKYRGLYRVTYILATKEPAVFGLIVNERLVTSSVARTAAPGQKAIGQAIIQLECNDCLEIRNCTGNRVALDGFAGGAERTVHASILLNLL